MRHVRPCKYSRPCTAIIRAKHFAVKNSHCEKPLRVIFNQELTFDRRTSGLCKKASKKVHALAKLMKTYYENFF